MAAEFSFAITLPRQMTASKMLDVLTKTFCTLYTALKLTQKAATLRMRAARNKIVQMKKEASQVESMPVNAAEM